MTFPSHPSPMPEARAATIVVADAGLAEQLRRAGRGPIIAVDHYLDALGEMSRRPVEVVVGRIEPMARSMESTVRALRELSPHGRLLLVVDAYEEPEAIRAVRLGFDDYIVQPIDPHELLEKLFVETRDAPGLQLPNAEPQSLLSGDPELLDYLLLRHTPITGPALHLARRRLAIDLRFTPGADTGDPRSAAVRFGSQTFGHLAAEGVTLGDLAAVADWLARWLAIEDRLNALSDLANRDELTGLWNRRYFRWVLGSILEIARRRRLRVTLMLYDIDGFKGYNDRYGHPAGDEILRETARLMQSVVRKQDVVARIGGDEFAVIFWEAEPPRRAPSEHPKDVRAAAERFQKAVEQQRFPKLGEQARGPLTVSAGLAGYPGDGENADAMIATADRMLRESKAQGKNAVTFGPGAQRH